MSEIILRKSRKSIAELPVGQNRVPRQYRYFEVPGRIGEKGPDKVTSFESNLAKSYDCRRVRNDAAALAVLKDFLADLSQAPSVAEFHGVLRVGSTRIALQYLSQLETAGKIERA